MASAANYVDAYQVQTGSDANDSVELLADFLISYGMTEAAIEALCQLIDDEGICGDFAQLLRENGLVVDGVDEGRDPEGRADLE
jgi:hypothetical protein